MKRRAFLGTAGIAITGIAGYTAQAASRDESPDAAQNAPDGDQQTSESTERTRKGERTRVPAGETETVTVGDGTLSPDGARKPHGIVFDNPTAESWTGRLSIRRPDGSVALDEGYKLEPESAVAVSLTAPLRYSAAVHVPETGATATVEVDTEWFDCNASSTSFTIMSDGSVESGTVSTMIACGASGDSIGGSNGR